MDDIPSSWPLRYKVMAVVLGALIVTSQATTRSYALTWQEMHAVCGPDDVCEWFFVGAFDALAIAGDPSVSCMPTGVSYRTAYAVFRTYINAHPEEWHLETVILVQRSLAHGYPCS
jgi:hypothetical protein